MSADALLGIWSDSVALSVVIWLVLLVVVLYAGRRWLEPFFADLFRGVDRLLRFCTRSVRAAARYVSRSHRAYMRGLERARLDHRLHRELAGLHDRVNRDLGGYPVLQRAMHEQIQRLERDYHAAQDMPPAEPAWLCTVAELSKTPPQGDPAVARVLEDIHDGLQRASRAAQDEYHAASRKRLELLRAMLPAWRELSDRLRGVEQAIQGVVSRSRQVDEILSRQRSLAEGGPEMDAVLVAGSFGRMLVSGALLMLVGLAAVVNFHLIQRPMAEAVGVAQLVGPWPLSTLASGLLILLAVTAGLVMTETRRVTALIPGLGTVDPGVRRWLSALGLLVLAAIAVLQGAMAFSRQAYVMQDQALSLLVTVEPQAMALVAEWIPTVTRMLLGLVLPLLLALFAVPLESFMRHVRAVLGVVLAVVLQLLGFALGVLVRVVRWVASLTAVIYGLLVFVPVRIEEKVRHRINGREPTTEEALDVVRRGE